jgi:alpha-beta hydrolase superfamily lysophospholipase
MIRPNIAASFGLALSMLAGSGCGAPAAEPPAATGECSFELRGSAAASLEPGHAICQEAGDRWQVAGTGHRMMYVSEDEKGAHVPVTGAIFVPLGTPPPQGWPILAWAHGTVGVGKSCAPSARANLFWDEYATFVNSFVQKGFMVVATDYEGLGTHGDHKYVHLDNAARNTIDAVLAAREIVPDAGLEVVAIGHSQGGHAALGAGELIEKRGASLHYRGTVAIAPAANLALAPPILASYAPADAYDILMFFASSMKTIYPDFAYSDFLAPELVAEMPNARTLCDDELTNRLTTFSQLDNPLSQDWSDNANVKDFLARNEPAQRPTFGPLLLVQGGADPIVPPASTRLVQMAACSMKDSVTYREYAGEDHDTVLVRSFDDIERWIEDRLGQVEPVNDCTAGQ